MKSIKPFTLLRIGLALVFLANSLTAFLDPGEFIDLVSGSFLGQILPLTAEHFVVLIGVNDALVALALFVGFDLSLITIWATLWILGVMTIKGVSLGTLEEAGFLFMAIDLIVMLRRKES